MAKAKQYVFSARTTEEGLRQLNRLKAERGIGWDDLVIDAVCAHYGLDKLAMALPKPYEAAEKPKEEKKGGKGKYGNPAGCRRSRGQLGRWGLIKLAPEAGLEPTTKRLCVAQSIYESRAVGK